MEFTIEADSGGRKRQAHSGLGRPVDIILAGWPTQRNRGSRGGSGIEVVGSLSSIRACNHPEEHKESVCHCGITHMALSQWQDGLSKTRLDSNIIRNIIELETSVSNRYDKSGHDFVNFLLETYDKKKSISPDDLNKAYLSVFDDVTLDITTPYAIYFKSIMDSGRDKAMKDLGMGREARRKLRKSAAIGDPYIQDSLEKSFTHVKTVSDDVIQQLTDKWSDVGGPTGIVKDLLMQEEEKMRGEVGSREELKSRLYDIWQSKRYLLERIVRTETINTYARAQLQEWYDQGVREVERHEVNDLRTCGLCRVLAQPGNNVYEIEKLLNGEYSAETSGGRIITSAEYPISYNSHPNCRGSYTPRVNWSVFEEFERLFLEPEKGEFQNASNVVTSTTVAENVPVEYQGEVLQALEDFGPDYKIRFVPEITDSPEWNSDRLGELRQYFSEGEAQARLNLEKGENRGKMVQYTAKNGTVLVSGDAGDVNRIVIPILREHAHQVWSSAPEDQKEWIRERFRQKVKEMEFSLRREGIEIFGDTPFVSPLAKGSPEDYFVESYASFVADPSRLLYFDGKMYDFLRGNFIDREYIARGGLN